MAYPLIRLTGIAMLALAATACQSEPDNALAELDDALLENENRSGDASGNSADGRIVVDPRLAGKAAGTGTAGVGGDVPLKRAPAPVDMADCPECKSGALAQGRKNTGNCAANVSYGRQWADRLPRDLPMIPGARLVEAAGNANGNCALRVVNFMTELPMQTAVDWYYTRATQAGYSAEHQVDGAQHILGGVRGRDDAAYVVFLTPRTGGGTEIDLVANKGA